MAMSLGELVWSNHVHAWQDIWDSGLEVAGNVELAKAINSSMYYVLSSISSDWPYGLSPGSLSSNSYNGHSFWDTETWMYPTLCLLHPGLAESLMMYRINRLDGAIKKAQSYKPPYKGALYPWESALTGIETCPEWAATGLREIHINGDISLAMEQLWNSTHDEAFLRKALPMLEGIADFWVNKAVLDKATDEYHILDVIPPDEYVEHADNSAYTNAVARISIEFTSKVLRLFGYTVPSLYAEVSSKLRMPFDAKNRVHLEYDGYAGQKIKQADVVLLGYPLMVPMSREVRYNDLVYYSERTDYNGPTMTYGMHAVAWLELGMTENATEAFRRSYENQRPPFAVWAEAPSGGAVNFITGAGGFLQGVWAGYGGIRTHELGFFATPRLPPKTTGLRIRGISLLGAAIDLSHNGKTTELLMRRSTSTHKPICVGPPGGPESTLTEGVPFVTNDQTIDVRVC
jgi:trehalose/maltose hydrolase-like predicted phosphorylase